MIRQDLRKALNSYPPLSLNELREMRAASHMNWTPAEKGGITRKIREKVKPDRYSPSQRQKLAARLNWILYQAQGAKGSVRNASYQMSCAHIQQSGLSPEQAMKLTKIHVKSLEAEEALAELIAAVKEFNALPKSKD